jgi:hypothetical protein
MDKKALLIAVGAGFAVLLLMLLIWVLFSNPDNFGTGPEVALNSDADLKTDSKTGTVSSFDFASLIASSTGYECTVAFQDNVHFRFLNNKFVYIQDLSNYPGASDLVSPKGIWKNNKLYVEVPPEMKRVFSQMGSFGFECDWIVYEPNTKTTANMGAPDIDSLRRAQASSYNCYPVNVSENEFLTPGKTCAPDEFLQQSYSPRNFPL